MYKDYFEHKFDWFNCILISYGYGGFDAWPINREFLGDDRAIFRVGIFHSLAFHCKTLNMAWYF
jgi:hypothetical protein